jgi:hypothetical protein
MINRPESEPGARCYRRGFSPIDYRDSEVKHHIEAIGPDEARQRADICVLRTPNIALKLHARDSANYLRKRDGLKRILYES